MPNQTPIFDGHNDTLLKLEVASRLGKDLDFADTRGETDIDLSRARAGGFAGGLFAMFTPSRLDRFDEPFDFADSANFAEIAQPQALGFTLAMFARLRRLAHTHSTQWVICEDGQAARAAIAQGQIAIVPHIEGAECIDTDLNALEVLYAAGLRSLGLVWSRPNAFGHGAPMERQPELDPGLGLTSAGLELVRACEQLGILVDLSHLTEAGFWDVAKIATRPLIASHSNVHALSPSARNLTDRQLEAVADSGGLVGLNFHVGFLREDCAPNRDTPIEQLIRHLDHLLGILGEGGVAIGSDFDGCILPAGLSDVSRLPNLTDGMRRAGYGEPLIARICRDNWLDALSRT